MKTFVRKDKKVTMIFSYTEFELLKEKVEDNIKTNSTSNIGNSFTEQLVRIVFKTYCEMKGKNNDKPEKRLGDNEEKKTTSKSKKNGGKKPKK